MLTKVQLLAIEEYDFKELLEFMSREYSGQDAICYHDIPNGVWVRKTTNEFRDDVEKCAAYVQSAFGREKHLAICSANSYAYACMFFGIIQSGNVAVLLDATMQGEQLDTALKMTDSAVCFAGNGLMSKERYQTNDMFQALEQVHCKALEEANTAYIYEKNREGLAILFSTSGVTSNPKYVMISQKNMIYAALNGVYRLPLDKGFTALSILPPHHVFEVCCGLLYPMISGGTIVQNDSPANLRENLAKHAPSFLVAVPTVIAMLNMLYHAETAMRGTSCVSSLKHIIGGGACVQKELIQDFHQNGIYVIQGYGLTETGASVAMNGVDDFTADTVGTPMQFSKVKLCDGEIVVSAPDVMLGYYKNPLATQEVYDGEWFRTGDIGSFDEQGHLIIHGRIKNVIVLPTGENVYPEELEEKLNRNRGMDYCKVYGENNRIAVDIFSTVLTKEQIDGIVAAFNESVMSHQRIAIVRVLTEKPITTALGKPLRR